MTNPRGIRSSPKVTRSTTSMPTANPLPSSDHFQISTLSNSLSSTDTANVEVKSDNDGSLMAVEWSDASDLLMNEWVLCGIALWALCCCTSVFVCLNCIRRRRRQKLRLRHSHRKRQKQKKSIRKRKRKHKRMAKAKQKEADCDDGEAEDSLSLRMPHFTQYGQYARGGLATRDFCKDTFSVDVEVVLREEQELQERQELKVKDRAETLDVGRCIGPLTPRDLDDENVDEDGYVVEDLAVEGEEDRTIKRLVLTTLNTSDLL